MSTELLDYLRKREKWAEEFVVGKRLKLTISELPEPLRSHMITTIQARYLRSDYSSLSAAWLSDDLWKRATISISEIGRVPTLAISSKWTGLGANGSKQLSTTRVIAYLDPVKAH
ncbi:MAG: hypothetical protein EOP09_20305 [Proteobacteria bacterium]|nr:MAG: hypothetical protein EOP09_20305 [Pseudomonadota bacterium]